MTGSFFLRLISLRFKGLFITFFILFLFIQLLIHSQDSTLFVTAGITDTLKEIKDTIIGIKNFINSLYTITSAIGFKTLVFFAAVMLFSSGISSLGISRGPVSFIAAIILVNSIWYIWNSSMPDTAGISSQMLYSNAVVVSPVACIYFIKYISRVIIRRIQKKDIAHTASSREILSSVTLLTGKAQEQLIKDGDSGLSAESHEALTAIVKYISSIDNQKNSSGTNANDTQH